MRGFGHPGQDIASQGLKNFLTGNQQPWLPGEITLIEANLREPTEVLVQQFKRYGFNRTPKAIEKKRLTIANQRIYQKKETKMVKENTTDTVETDKNDPMRDMDGKKFEEPDVPRETVKRVPSPPAYWSWEHRSSAMKCQTCMWFVEKAGPSTTKLGRCRRHAPTMAGYPAVFQSDWCGDHKVDENKI